jgi:hypothetical protein
VVRSLGIAALRASRLLARANGSFSQDEEQDQCHRVEAPPVAIGGGAFLPSRPGSFLASSEALRIVRLRRTRGARLASTGLCMYTGHAASEPSREVQGGSREPRRPRRAHVVSRPRAARHRAPARDLGCRFSGALGGSTLRRDRGPHGTWRSTRRAAGS